MNKLDAYKMDGLGNDFIIFDKRKKSISLTKDQIIKIRIEAILDVTKLFLSTTIKVAMLT